MGDFTATGTAAQDDADIELVASWFAVADGYAHTQRILMARVEARGLSPQWFEVLLRLLRSPRHRMSMSKLASEVGMTSGGLTKLADRLENGGLLRRENDPDDRRLVYAALTDDGEKVAVEAVEGHNDNLRTTLLDVLSVDEVHQLAALMTRLRDAR